MNHFFHTLISLILCSAIGNTGLFGQETDRFAEGNRYYEQKDYANAISSYEAILGESLESPDVYYNLGNAHYQLGHIAPAILNYERALKMAPAHEDARFNLELANLRVVDRITPNPEFFILASWREFRDGRSSGQWAAWTVGALWLALVLGALFLFGNKTLFKRIGFFGGIAMLLLGIVLGIIAMNRHYLETHSQYAVILSPNVYVKNAPDVNGTDLFILHEGTKVKLSDSLEGWLEVMLEDGKEGWVKAEELEEI